MAKSTSKTFDDSDSKSAERWILPDVETMQTMLGDDGQLLSTTPLTAEQLQRIQRDAYREAYDDGLEKGFEDGIENSKEYLKKQVGLMNAVLNQCAAPIQDLDDEVESQLVELVIAITRQLIRREIKTEPGQIVAIVREAMQVLPVSSRNVSLHLHPEDVILIKQALASSENQFWKLLDDPTLARGDCKIQTDTSSIDATMERRMSSLIANMFADDRQQSNDSAQSDDYDSDQ